MPNQKQQLLNELSGLRQLLEMIESEFSKGVVNEDEDLVISEESATRIKMLLEQ